jgi:hypothetical protein
LFGGGETGGEGENIANRGREKEGGEGENVAKRWEKGRETGSGEGENVAKRGKRRRETNAGPSWQADRKEHSKNSLVSGKRKLKLKEVKLASVSILTTLDTTNVVNLFTSAVSLIHRTRPPNVTFTFNSCHCLPTQFSIFHSS